MIKKNLSLTDCEELQKDLLDSKIELVIGGSMIGSFELPCNIYLSNLLNKKLIENENEIIIPIFSIYYLCQVFNNNNVSSGFALQNLQWHQFQINLISKIKTYDNIKINIKFKYLDIYERNNLAYKNITIYSILSNNITQDYSDAQVNYDDNSVPLCLFLRTCNEYDNINIVNIKINNVDYEFNLLRGDADEFTIFGITYYVINLGNKNIKYVLKNILPKDIKHSKFRFDFDTLHQNFINAQFIYADRQILGSGYFFTTT